METGEEGRAHWRLMRREDVSAVDAIANHVHPTLPERVELYGNRMGLFPEGCIVLEEGGRIAGYGLAYPAPLRMPPPLDTLLDALPERADALYVHDVAVAPEWRGRGLAEAGIGRLLSLAAPDRAAMLVSVYGTGPFWARFGFRPCPDVVPAAKLAAYGPTAVYMERRGNEQCLETMRRPDEKG